jgi:endonuclease YncB( thermonuclease family)
MIAASQILVCCGLLLSCVSFALAQGPGLVDPCGNPAVESSLWGVVKGQVIKAEDGDTVVISLRDDRQLRDKKTRRVHLIGLDAPELRDSFGEASRLLLESLVKNRVIEVWVKTDVAFKSRVPAEIEGVVHLREIKMLDVNLLMIQAGLARHKRAEPYSMSNYIQCHYVRAEEEARAGRRGLWYRRN